MKDVFYHIYIDGQRITDEPLSLTAIKTIYGSIQQLEAAGFRALLINRKAN